MVTSIYLTNNFGIEANLSSDSIPLETLEQAYGLVQEKLQNFADDLEFSHKLDLAFGNSFDPQVAQNFRQSWQKGDFSSLPVIQILTASQLQGAKGAYTLATNSIYLSEEFINTNKFNPEIIGEVLLEEIGHFIDSRLNSIDSPGDEGAIFGVLVSQGILNIQQWQWFQQENDHRTLILDGQIVNVELADTYQGSNLSTIVNGLQTILTNLNTSLKTVALANQLPLVGNALKDVTDPALNFLNQLKNQLTSINTSSVSQVRQTLLNILGTGGLNWLRDQDSNGIINLNDIAVNDTANQVTFNFTLGNNPTTIAGGIGFNLGLPGLGLSVSDNSKVKTDIGFTFDFAFGANKDTGFFFDTGLNNELKVNLNTTLPEFNATGKLGFLAVGIKDNSSNPTNFAGTFGLDLQNGFTVAPTFNGQANINLSLLGKIPTTGDTSIPLLPSIGTDLSLQWGFNNANASNPLSSTFGNAPQLAFNNVSVNIGSFFSRFVSPILGKVQAALSPLKPILNFLNQDLPLLDQSIVDLLATANQIIPPGLPGAGLPLNTTGLQAIKYLDTILNIPTAPNVAIEVGDFNLGSGRDLRTQLLKDIDVNSFTSILNDIDQALRAIGANNAANYLKELSKGLDNRGLTFPLIQNPKEALKLLLGQDPDLFRWDLSNILRIGAQDGGFYGVGIGARIDYGFSAGINLILGYDTNGLRRFFDGNFSTPSLLGDGFYMVDLPGVEAYVNTNFYAGAGAGIEGANISVGGGIDGSINLNVNDPNADGKLRPSELDGCFLKGDGQIDASLAAKLVLGWGLFKLEKTFPIKKGTLISFEAGCQEGDPVRNILAKEENSKLVLLMGPRAGERVINGSSPGSQQDVAEYFALRPTAGQSGRVDVLAFGAIVSYAVGNQIIANWGLQGDVIVIDPAIATPAYLQGETGADQLVGGGGNDTLEGGDDDDFLDGGGGADQIDGGDGFDAVSYATSNAAIRIIPGSNGRLVGISGAADGDSLFSIEQVTGSNFNDTLNGDGANNTFDGGAGNDILRGNDGNDLLLGGAGADRIDGGNGSDVVSYIDSSAAVNVNLKTKAATGGDATGDTLIAIENAEGSQLEDILAGDDNDNLLSGQGGNDQLFGNAGNDTLDGGRDNDSLNGGDGEDVLYGKAGSDTLNGDAGNDILYGGADADSLNGGDGIDTANYSNSPSEVIVNLATGTANGGYKKTFINNAVTYSLVSDAIAVRTDPISGNDIVTGDRLTNVENIIGSRFNDKLDGDDKDNIFISGLSRTNIYFGFNFDIIDGGGGNDLLIIDYSVGEDATTGAMTGGGNIEEISRITPDGKNQVDGVRFSNIERLQVTATSKNDFLTGIVGDDTLNGGAGNDTLFGAYSNLSNIGNDVINGGDGDDDIYNRTYNAAGIDADLLDRFDGGAGNDTLSADFSNQTADITFISGQSNDIIFADGAYAKNFENIRYFRTGSGNDRIIQNGSLMANNIFTGLGDDTINAGLGNDNIDAGAGNDLLIINYSVGDDATAAGLNGFASGSSLSSSADFSRKNLDGSPRDRILAYNIERYQITGTSKADSFTGWFGDDTLNGGAGNDTITAFYGNDIVNGGNGDDEVIASFDRTTGTPFEDNGKLDKLDGGTGIDTLTAAFGNQTVDINFNSLNLTDFSFSDGTYARNFEILRNLQTGSGNDTLIQLGRFDNIFLTGAGNDTINGGLGFDDIDGGAGDDLLIIDYSVGDDANTGPVNIYWGGLYRRTVTNNNLDVIGYRNIERVQVTGTTKSDNLAGSSGNDTLKGAAGNDTIDGSNGNDILDGGAGNDSLNGSTGNDQFVFSSGRPFNSTDLGIDTIVDFEIGKDKLVLDTSTFTAGNAFASVASDGDVATNNAFIVYSAATGNLFYNANGSAADLGSGGQFAILSNRPTLTATDFNFISSNNPPILQNAIADQTIGEGQNFNFTIPANTFVDPGDSLTYSLSPTTILPDGLTFNATTGTLSGIPTSTTAGTYGITVSATDQGGLSVSDTFNLTVLNFIGTNGKDTLTGTAQGEKLEGRGGNDLLLGLGSHDSLYGGADNDSLHGGLGNDILFGQAGDDTLRGGLGSDRVTGGIGKDVFVFASSDGRDTITDFQISDDKIGLSAGLTFGQLRIIQGTGSNINNTLLRLKANNELLAILTGIQANTINSSLFVTVT